MPESTRKIALTEERATMLPLARTSLRKSGTRIQQIRAIRFRK
jgi:hypothetical protein